MKSVAKKKKTATSTPTPKPAPTVVRCSECGVVAINTDKHVGTITTHPDGESSIVCLECLDAGGLDADTIHSDEIVNGGRLLRCARRLKRLKVETERQWRWLRLTVASLEPQIMCAAEAYVKEQADLGEHIYYVDLRANLHVGDDGAFVVCVDRRPSKAPWKQAEGIVVVVHARGEDFEFVDLPRPQHAIDHDIQLAHDEMASGDHLEARKRWDELRKLGLDNDPAANGELPW